MQNKDKAPDSAPDSVETLKRRLELWKNKNTWDNDIRNFVAIAMEAKVNEEIRNVFTAKLISFVLTGNEMSEFTFKNERQKKLFLAICKGGSVEGDTEELILSGQSKRSEANLLSEGLGIEARINSVKEAFWSKFDAKYRSYENYDALKTAMQTFVDNIISVFRSEKFLSIESPSLSGRYQITEDIRNFDGQTRSNYVRRYLEDEISKLSIEGVLFFDFFQYELENRRESGQIWLLLAEDIRDLIIQILDIPGVYTKKPVSIPSAPPSSSPLPPPLFQESKPVGNGVVTKTLEEVILESLDRARKIVMGEGSRDRKEDEIASLLASNGILYTPALIGLSGEELSQRYWSIVKEVYESTLKSVDKYPSDIDSDTARLTRLTEAYSLHKTREDWRSELNYWTNKQNLESINKSPYFRGKLVHVLTGSKFGMDDSVPLVTQEDLDKFIGILRAKVASFSDESVSGGEDQEGEVPSLPVISRQPGKAVSPDSNVEVLKSKIDDLGMIIGQMDSEINKIPPAARKKSGSHYEKYRDLVKRRKVAQENYQKLYAQLQRLEKTKVSNPRQFAESLVTYLTESINGAQSRLDSFIESQGDITNDPKSIRRAFINILDKDKGGLDLDHFVDFGEVDKIMVEGEFLKNGMKIKGKDDLVIALLAARLDKQLKEKEDGVTKEKPKGGIMYKIGQGISGASFGMLSGLTKKGKEAKEIRVRRGYLALETRLKRQITARDQWFSKYITNVDTMTAFEKGKAGALFAGSAGFIFTALSIVAPSALVAAGITKTSVAAMGTGGILSTGIGSFTIAQAATRASMAGVAKFNKEIFQNIPVGTALWKAVREGTTQVLIAASVGLPASYVGTFVGAIVGSLLGATMETLGSSIRAGFSGLSQERMGVALGRMLSDQNFALSAYNFILLNKSNPQLIANTFSNLVLATGETAPGKTWGDIFFEKLGMSKPKLPSIPNPFAGPSAEEIEKAEELIRANPKEISPSQVKLIKDPSKIPFENFTKLNSNVLSAFSSEQMSKFTLLQWNYLIDSGNLKSVNLGQLGNVSMSEEHLKYFLSRVKSDPELIAHLNRPRTSILLDMAKISLISKTPTQVTKFLEENGFLVVDGKVNVVNRATPTAQPSLQTPVFPNPETDYVKNFKPSKGFPQELFNRLPDDLKIKAAILATQQNLIDDFFKKFTKKPNDPLLLGYFNDIDTQRQILGRRISGILNDINNQERTLSKSIREERLRETLISTRDLIEKYEKRVKTITPPTSPGTPAGPVTPPGPVAPPSPQPAPTPTTPGQPQPPTQPPTGTTRPGASLKGSIPPTYEIGGKKLTVQRPAVPIEFSGRRGAEGPMTDFYRQRLLLDGDKKLTQHQAENLVRNINYFAAKDFLELVDKKAKMQGIKVSPNFKAMLLQLQKGVPVSEAKLDAFYRSNLPNIKLDSQEMIELANKKITIRRPDPTTGRLVRVQDTALNLAIRLKSRY